MSYSPIAQINESIDFDASGKIQRQNVLINIREDSVHLAFQKYMELRGLILNGEKQTDNSEKKVAKTTADSMICDCGQEMILREGKDGFFFGCSGYFTTGCRNTKPASKNKQKIGAIGTGKKETDNSPVPQCPRHNVPMWLKSRQKDGQLFFGCPLFDQKGCLQTEPFQAPQQPNVKIPSVSY